ncbi:MAG: hypothetical protein LBI68_01885 [Azoarcus sp.]|nr:hypothetical protein [Azoarcus sp.]
MSEMADTQKQDDVLKFHANKWSPLMIALGLGVILALVSDVLPGTGGMWTITIVFVTLGFWKQFSAYITLDADCFEIKLAPAAGWHTVLYTEVTQVEKNGNVLNIYYAKHNTATNTKQLRIKLRLGELDETEQARFIDAFRARLPAMTGSQI